MQVDKLRLAIYFENRLGRNDGNPLYVWNAFKDKQKEGELEIDHLIPTGDISPFGTYDFHIWVDWGEDALTGVLPYKPFDCPKPMLYWASDTHLGFDYRLEMAKKADVAFVAQKRAMEEFKAHGVNTIWLPHSVEPQAYPNYCIPAKKYDVCFIGHMNSQNRIDALDQLFKAFPNFYYGQKLFEKAARKFCESKIVFNISILDDINMRIFETLATGSFLLTNNLPTLGDLFEDGKHFVTYENMDDAIEKAKYYIEHDDEREKIAQEGMSYVLQHHTFKNRTDRMLKEIHKTLELTGALT